MGRSHGVLDLPRGRFNRILIGGEPRWWCVHAWIKRARMLAVVATHAACRVGTRHVDPWSRVSIAVDRGISWSTEIVRRPISATAEPRITELGGRLASVPPRSVTTCRPWLSFATACPRLAILFTAAVSDTAPSPASRMLVDLDISPLLSLLLSAHSTPRD